MSDTEKLQLSLLGNSHAFTVEAVRKALLAQREPREWQFAIFSIVQAVELSLKAALQAIHPMFIYESVDTQKRTVSLAVALSRLADPAIGGLVLSERDSGRIRRASELRNQVTHADFELNSRYVAASFFVILGFVTEFQRKHLGCNLASVIPSADFEKLMECRSALEELVRRAEERLRDEEIDGDLVWTCPCCGAGAFVIQDGLDVCFACSHSEPVRECPQCREFAFCASIESFADCVDYGIEEGRVEIYNSYGFSEFEACPKCLPEVKAAIEDQREVDDLYALMEEHGR